MFFLLNILVSPQNHPFFPQNIKDICVIGKKVVTLRGIIVYHGKPI